MSAWSTAHPGDPYGDIMNMIEELSRDGYYGRHKHHAMKRGLLESCLEDDPNISVIYLDDPVMDVVLEDLIDIYGMANPTSLHDFLVWAFIRKGCIFGPNGPCWDFGRCDA